MTELAGGIKRLMQKDPRSGSQFCPDPLRGVGVGQGSGRFCPRGSHHCPLTVTSRWSGCAAPLGHDDQSESKRTFWNSAGDPASTHKSVAEGISGNIRQQPPRSPWRARAGRVQPGGTGPAPPQRLPWAPVPDLQLEEFWETLLHPSSLALKQTVDILTRRSGELRRPEAHEDDKGSESSAASVFVEQVSSKHTLTDDQPHGRVLHWAP